MFNSPLIPEMSPIVIAVEILPTFFFRECQEGLALVFFLFEICVFDEAFFFGMASSPFESKAATNDRRGSGFRAYRGWR
jgi:hypothetical protein